MNDFLAVFPELPLIVALAAGALVLRVVRALVLGALLVLALAVGAAVVVGLLVFTIAALMLH